MNWNECKKLTDGIDVHYGMTPYAYKAIYEAAATLPTKSTILELGVCHGKTAAILAYVAKYKEGRYFGIDDFSLEGTASEVRQMLSDRKLAGIIIESRTQDAKWDEPVDLLLVDAGHDEVNVKADFEKYTQFVKPGGIIIIDDYGDNVGAHWAVTHYADECTGDWEHLLWVPAIEIRRRPL